VSQVYEKKSTLLQQQLLELQRWLPDEDNNEDNEEDEDDEDDDDATPTAYTGGEVYYEVGSSTMEQEEVEDSFQTEEAEQEEEDTSFTLSLQSESLLDQSRAASEERKR
jgi:hypothetical protein